MRRSTFTRATCFAAVLVSATLAMQSKPAGAEEPQGAFIEVQGAKLWCLDSGGSGDVIVFLHANTGSSETFLTRQFPAFTGQGFRALACDRRSSGKSSPKSVDADGQGSVAGDTVAVLDVLSIDKASVLGVAGGGFAALDLAANYPDRIDKLIVGASNGRIQDKEIQDFRSAIAIPGLRDLPSHAYRELSPTYRGLDGPGVNEWERIETKAHFEAKPQKERTPNTFEKLSTISAKTLVIAGGADLLAPPALMEIWAAHIPDSMLVKMPEVGHAISWEKPEEFNAIVLKFLARP
ncbi:Pimeloyl-ACP methyl ester carboxylesterase [Paracoccus saliphilus]|uniref:Pimeloyl-ACP methyl ester carboxylesterase n=1 Tax=Paracoccus saliphilus TaxID=405559 RepID=A0AA46A7E8_9RHOB|nr:Pimeloyl-ACP methyl ester carboxylesterase [Paracoccus saliphilus]